MSKYNLLFLVVFSYLLNGCGGESSIRGEVTKAFFGDKENNRVIVANVKNMKLAQPNSEVYTGHQMTYTADKVWYMPKVYAVNRGSNAIDVIDVNTVELKKTIDLEHHPRSAESINRTLGLCAVSGMDKPMLTIIDIITDKVVSVVGDNTPVDKNNNPNHGGPHATGHPFWLDAHHFVLLDRYKRKIFTYYIEFNDNKKWETTLLNEINTTTSIHQIIPSICRGGAGGNFQGDNNTFYATAEGSDEDYPSIIELKLIQGEGLVQTGELPLIKEGVDKSDMWLHHGDFHPTEKLIYVGSGDGTLFIMNYGTNPISIEKTIKAGKGAGHIMFSPQKNLAIIVNHNDNFVTIVNTKTNEKVTDVVVSEKESSLDYTIQAHPEYHISSNGRYFYSFLTEEGRLYELDLDTLKVTRTLNVGGKPTQGSFVRY